ncbi:MAG TPA: DUF222 domain-containing protein, partial [Acidimicrobiales bacterium]|nr:DUF222 domain-containing protein [Acidimicrobiales bacterium]
RYATVSQLRRTLGRYGFPPVSPPPAGPHPEVDPEAPAPRRASFGVGADGAWRLSALLPPDEGAVVEGALSRARSELIAAAESEEDKRTVTWADAVAAVAERHLSSDAAARPHAERHLVHIHLEVDAQGPFASFHLGPFLPDALRRQLGCDARARLVIRHGGVALSVGRSARIVPQRTRVAIEQRDGGCRVPGCDRRRWLQVHHLAHWEDGGPTDTANLVALCSKHHRLHHRGLLAIAGHDADDPGGLVFTDARGRRLTGSGRPAPPEHLEVTATYSHPSGERLDPACVWFRPPPDSPPPRVVTEPLPTDVYRPHPTSFAVYLPGPATAAGDNGWGPDSGSPRSPGRCRSPTRNRPRER